MGNDSNIGSESKETKLVNEWIIESNVKLTNNQFCNLIRKIKELRK